MDSDKEVPMMRMPHALSRPDQGKPSESTQKKVDNVVIAPAGKSQPEKKK